MDFLATHSVWLSAFVLLVPTTLLAMAGPVVVRRYIRLSRLRTNNEVAGFKFATIGVLYAVLLAFAVVVVWEKFNDADKDVALEASSAATVYRLSRGLDETHGGAVRKAMTDYLNAAITQDWPAMERGKSSPAGAGAMNALYDAALRFHTPEPGEAIVLGELLRQIDQVSQGRRGRLVTANGIVPDVLWAVLVGGAVLTVCFTLFFGTENLLAQTLMTGALTLLIFAGLLTIVAIDHPFAGTVKVGPGALIAVVEDFGGR